MKKLIVLICSLTFIITSQSEELYNETIVTFAISPYTTPLSTYTKQEKLVRYLETTTGFTFKTIILKNDQEMLDYYRAGKIDAAWIGTFQYVKYKTSLYSYVLARPVRYKREFYRGAIITHVDSEINTLSDLKGKHIAFVSKTSEAGYIFPALTLSKAGLSMTKDYYPEFLRGHDNVVYNIHQKKYDAGAVFDTALEIYLNKNQQSKIRIIGYTKEIPYEPIIISKSVGSETAQKIQAAFVECQARGLLRDIKVDNFIMGSEAPYQLYQPSLYQIIDTKSETP